MDITFSADLWEWQGKGAWCFVTLPIEYTEEIKLISSSPKKGFGSVRVEATIGNTIWKTSIFPDTKSNSYILPVKKTVRSAEHLSVGDSTLAHINILDI